MFKKKIQLGLVLDLSITRDMTGIIIRDTEGFNISQRFKQSGPSKCLNYKLISDNVLRKIPDDQQLKIVQFIYNRELDDLTDMKIITGVKSDIVGTLEA